MAKFDREVLEARADFAARPADPHDVEWVKAKLQLNADIDQKPGELSEEALGGISISAQDLRYYRVESWRRYLAIVADNTADMKWLLGIHEWIRISVFGAEADSNACLAIQHADDDIAFQRQVLEVLARMVPLGETNRQSYAYLYDRVAISWKHPAEAKPQRYGTQGDCVAPGKWQPFAMEDADRLAERRASMDLEPMSDYLELMNGLCADWDPAIEPWWW